MAKYCASRSLRNTLDCPRTGFVSLKRIQGTAVPRKTRRDEPPEVWTPGEHDCPSRVPPEQGEAVEDGCATAATASGRTARTMPVVNLLTSLQRVPRCRTTLRTATETRDEASIVALRYRVASERGDRGEHRTAQCSVRRVSGVESQSHEITSARARQACMPSRRGRQGHPDHEGEREDGTPTHAPRSHYPLQARRLLSAIQSASIVEALSAHTTDWGSR